MGKFLQGRLDLGFVRAACGAFNCSGCVGCRSNRLAILGSGAPRSDAKGVAGVKQFSYDKSIGHGIVRYETKRMD
jgi:hypothetical protein